MNQEEVDLIMSQLPEGIRRVWCNPKGGCACVGCINIFGKVEEKGITHEMWLKWIARTGKSQKDIKE